MPHQKEVNKLISAIQRLLKRYKDAGVAADDRLKSALAELQRKDRYAVRSGLDTVQDVCMAASHQGEDVVADELWGEVWALANSIRLPGGS